MIEIIYIMVDAVGTVSIFVAMLSGIGSSFIMAYWAPIRKYKADKKLQDQKHDFDDYLQHRKDEIELLKKQMEGSQEVYRQNSENVLQETNRQAQKELAWFNVEASRENERERFIFESERAKQAAYNTYLIDVYKRLYQEFEPLAFQLNELSGAALSCIHSLAANARKGWLNKDTGLLSSDKGSYFVYAMYSLLAPLAVTKLMRHRLTLFDLNLDTSVKTQFFYWKGAL